jgi:aminopeptidase N
VLQFAHVTDGDYYAMNAVPGNVTYGSTVYEKGPEVVHTLRNFMGDNLFFKACQDYMDSLAFGNANSHDLRDVFAISSGLDLEPFFDGWVFEPGFPHWQIDSYTVTPIFDAFEVEIHIRQKQRGNNHIYGMKLPINLTDGTQNLDEMVEMTQETQSFTITCPFEPQLVTIDRWEKMSDAIADFELEIASTGNKTFNQTNVSIDVQTVGNGPSIVRIEDHFVQPDGFIGQNPGIVLNPYHYWSVDGIFAEDFHAEATFKYNGSTNTSQGWMDNDLIVDTEDSLIFLYREGVGSEWREVNGYEMVTGASLTNKQGTVDVDTLKKGEYVLARRDFMASISASSNNETVTFVYPNPNSGVFNVQLPAGKWNLELFDLSGKRISTWNVTNGQEIRTEELAKGQYLLRASNGNELLSQSLIIQ